jgi:hypothetical protein
MEPPEEGSSRLNVNQDATMAGTIWGKLKTELSSEFQMNSIFHN